MINITQHKNRKLYVPGASRYTNLSEIKELVQSGERITVIDDATGEDVTSHILSQVLVKTNRVSAEKIAELIRKGE